MEAIVQPSNIDDYYAVLWIKPTESIPDHWRISFDTADGKFELTFAQFREAVGREAQGGVIQK